MTRTIANQFPNFDGTFELLPGFSDSSWGNDVCPSQTRTLPDGALLRVWHDFADVERREFDGGCLYAVDLTRDGEPQVDLMASDDWAEVVAFVADLCNPSPVGLARWFCRKLTETLTAEHLADAVRLNAAARAAGDLSVCHSHDHCDANQVMLDAMALYGLDFDPNDEKLTALINSAWDIAKAADFLPTSCFAVGSLVRYIDPLDESEEQARFKVVELRGPRVLIELVCDMAIKPTESQLGSDLIDA